MHVSVRVAVATALILVGLDAHAKVADKCIQTLEARPIRPDASPPRSCPLAIRHVVPSKALPGPGGRSESAARAQPTPLEAAGPTALRDAALHV